jgi:hypothetical protein
MGAGHLMAQAPPVMPIGVAAQKYCASADYVRVLRTSSKPKACSRHSRLGAAADRQFRPVLISWADLYGPGDLAA